MIVSRLSELNHKVAPPTVKPPQAQAPESFRDVISAAVQSKQPKPRAQDNESQMPVAVSNEKPAEPKVKSEDHDTVGNTDTRAAELVAGQTSTIQAQEIRDGDGAVESTEASALEAEAPKQDTDLVRRSEIVGRLIPQQQEIPGQSAATQLADESRANTPEPAVQVADVEPAQSDAAATIHKLLQSTQKSIEPKLQAESVVPVVTPNSPKRAESKSETSKSPAVAPVKVEEPPASLKPQPPTQSQAEALAEPREQQVMQHKGETKPAQEKSDTDAQGVSQPDRAADPRLAQVTIESALLGDAAGELSTATTAMTSTPDASGGGSSHSIEAKPATGDATAKDKANSQDHEAARLSEQATRALRSVVNQKGGSVTLRLTPPELGALRVRVEMSSSMISARFEAETEGVRSILQQNLSSLRSALESQGLTVQSLHVQLAPQAAPQEQSFNGGDDGRSRGSFDQQRSPDGGSSGEEARQRADQRRAAFEQQLNLVA